MSQLMLIPMQGGNMGHDYPAKSPVAPESIWEVVVGVVLLLLLWFLFAKFVSPSFEEMYERRTNEIEGGILRADNAVREATRAKLELEAQLEAARAEAAQVREDAKSQGSQILAEMREQAGQESTRQLSLARSQIASEREFAQSQLRGELGQLATVLAGRIMEESLIDETRARRTIDQFIADLEKQPVRTATNRQE